MANNLPEPETRKEIFLASAAGQSVSKPDPVTREEMFLDAIAKGGGVSPDDAYTKAQTDALLASKVDKETGKGLSTNDFTNADKTDLSTALAKANAAAPQATTYTKAEVDTALSDKVDKEAGKGLSKNDFTDADKTDLTAALTKANAAAPQSTTYTKSEVNTALAEKLNTSDVDEALSSTSTNPVQNKVIKSALDGKADVTDIPTVPITAIQKNGTDITPVSGTVNITVPTTAADISALPDTTKYAAALSLTINSSNFVMTGQLKDQNGDNLGTEQTIDLPLESVVVGGAYNSQTKKVVLTLQNGNAIEFSVADLVSGLQTELSASNKLNPAYINYDSTHRAVSDTEKSNWNGKQSALTTAQLAAVNSGITSEGTAQIETNKNNITLLAMRKVYGTVHNTSTTHTYTMNTSDFNGSQAGTYLITLVTWSATPSFSLYAVSYSGNVITTTNLTKIAGADANVSVTDGVISCTTTGKIQIIAVQ